jgi:hypothetical protein
MMRFASGRNSITICKRCGLQYPYPEPSIEVDTIEWVCQDCLDEPDPYRRRRPLIDAQGLPPLTQSPDVPLAYPTVACYVDTTISATTSPCQYTCGADITLTLPLASDVQALDFPTLWQVGVDNQGNTIQIQAQSGNLINYLQSIQLSEFGNYGVTLEGDMFWVE